MPTAVVTRYVIGLAASVLLLPLLAIFYLVCGPAPSTDARSEKVASKPHFEADTGRVKVLRPARIQMRVPRASRDLSGRAGGDRWKDLSLTLVSVDPKGPLLVRVRLLVASERPPSLLLFRTRNPRDSPRLI
jgi:hypothetical protein